MNNKIYKLSLALLCWAQAATGVYAYDWFLDSWTCNTATYYGCSQERLDDIANSLKAQAENASATLPDESEKNTEEKETDSTATSEEVAKEQNHAETLAAPASFSYEAVEQVLGIKLMAETHPAMKKGKDVTPELIATAVTAVEKAYKENKRLAGLTYWISLHRANMPLAMGLIDSDKLSDKTRLDLLLNAPAVFMGKLLSDIHSATTDEKYLHWGVFNIVHPEINGGNVIKNQALISGRALPLVYFMTVLFKDVAYASELIQSRFDYMHVPRMTVQEKVTHTNRVVTTIKWLELLNDDAIAQILILGKNANQFTVGDENPACHGNWKKAGICNAPQTLELPIDIIVGYICGLLANDQYASAALKVLDRQAKVDEAKAEIIESILANQYPAAYSLLNKARGQTEQNWLWEWEENYNQLQIAATGTEPSLFTTVNATDHTNNQTAFIISSEDDDEDLN